MEDKKPGVEQILYEGEVMQQIAAETVLACTVEQTTNVEDHAVTDSVGDDDLTSQESSPSCSVCRRQCSRSGSTCWTFYLKKNDGNVQKVPVISRKTFITRISFLLAS
jgi:hypothetical protein